ncbi:hypothetical protein B0H10DRAFT_1946270 [Mycena sp. CBHHK59/15]|nr:hypothetical protein B0H10DRAFT_1946270 [Mycena sp. CBHHK59/15]
MLPKLYSMLHLFQCLCPTSSPAFRCLQSTQIPNPQEGKPSSEYWRDRWNEREHFTKHLAELDSNHTQHITQHNKHIAELESKLNIYNKEDKTTAYERGKLEQQHVPATDPITKLKLSISALKVQIAKIQNNLNPWSAIEIISEVFWQKACIQAPKLLLAGSIQPILDAIVGRSFDDHVKYADTQVAVVAAIALGGGIAAKAITQSLSKLYMELSKHHHSGVSDMIEIHENKQTMAEAIIAMSILLYTRQLYGSPLDAVLRDKNKSLVADGAQPAHDLHARISLTSRWVNATVIMIDLGGTCNSDSDAE